MIHPLQLYFPIPFSVLFIISIHLNAGNHKSSAFKLAIKSKNTLSTTVFANEKTKQINFLLQLSTDTVYQEIILSNYLQLGYLHIHHIRDKNSAHPIQLKERSYSVGKPFPPGQADQMFSWCFQEFLKQWFRIYLQISPNKPNPGLYPPCSPPPSSSSQHLPLLVGNWGITHLFLLIGVQRFPILQRQKKKKEQNLATLNWDEDPFDHSADILLKLLLIGLETPLASL